MMTDDSERKTEGGARPAAIPGGFHGLSGGRHLCVVLGLLFSVLCLCSGCGNAEQAQAYARAEQAEQRFSLETAPAIIADYRRVIALDPKSDWAKKAGARIHAVEARVRAEETHKDVFQEHGVD
jgi:hypothetical protein